LLLQVVFIVILIVAIWVIFINLYGALKVNTEIAISIAIIVALGLVGNQQIVLDVAKTTNTTKNKF